MNPDLEEVDKAKTPNKNNNGSGSSLQQQALTSAVTKTVVMNLTHSERKIENKRDSMNLSK